MSDISQNDLFAECLKYLAASHPSAENILSREFEIMIAPGRTSRGYEFKDQIAVGGCDALFRGFQSSVDCEVAIKVILPEHANTLQFISRF